MFWPCAGMPSWHPFAPLSFLPSIHKVSNFFYHTSSSMMCCLNTVPSNRSTNNGLKPPELIPNKPFLSLMWSFSGICHSIAKLTNTVCLIVNKIQTQEFSKIQDPSIEKSKMEVIFWSLYSYPTPWPDFCLVLFYCNHIYSSALVRSLGLKIGSTLHLSLSRVNVSHKSCTICF